MMEIPRYSVPVPDGYKYVAIPMQVFDDLMAGKITNRMFVVLVWLYRRTNWRTGQVARVSSDQIRAELYPDGYEGVPSKQTIQKALRTLDRCGYITSHHVRGRIGTYTVTIHNYVAYLEDGEILLNPSITTAYRELKPNREAEVRLRQRRGEAELRLSVGGGEDEVRLRPTITHYPQSPQSPDSPDSPDQPDQSSVRSEEDKPKLPCGCEGFSVAACSECEALFCCQHSGYLSDDGQTALCPACCDVHRQPCGCSMSTAYGCDRCRQVVCSVHQGEHAVKEKNTGERQLWCTSCADKYGIPARKSQAAQG